MMTFAETCLRPVPSPHPMPGSALEAGPNDVESTRRRHKVRLLRDLVAHGLYVVRTDELAERLVPVFSTGR